MRATVVPGVFSWSVWQPDRNLDFNGFFIEGDDGNLVVDPIAPDDATLAALRERGVAAIVVTNRDHERASAAVAEATGAPVVASELDAPLLARPPERTVAPGDSILGWTVLGFEGLKTPGEIALYDGRRAAAIVGDALWGMPAGALTPMRDEKLGDPERALLSLRQLRAQPALDHLLVGDGACVFGNARDVLDATFAARPGLATMRVNVDELRYAGRPGVPVRFDSLRAELGFVIGSRALGSAVVKLRPGEYSGPFHHHLEEEELFLVLRGTPTVRTPSGTFTLRSGDAVAFPVGARGSHQLRNDGDEDAVVVMIAANHADETAFFPDSKKVVVRSTGLVVRTEPQLPFFEGEGAPAS